MISVNGRGEDLAVLPIGNTAGFSLLCTKTKHRHHPLMFRFAWEIIAGLVQALLIEGLSSYVESLISRVILTRAKSTAEIHRRMHRRRRRRLLERLST